ncbi:Protein root UVB sensitive 3 [Linum perenne]
MAGGESSEMNSSPSEQVMVIEEWNGSSSTKLFKTATLTASSASSSSPSISIQRFFYRSGSRFSHIWRGILQAFVPEGFPSSVTPDYVPFQVWDSLQALLSAIGVGEKSATVIGATFQWFLRDLTGMVGGILFTFYQGSSLDSNAKMWRLVADLMNDLGIYCPLAQFIHPLASFNFAYRLLNVTYELGFKSLLGYHNPVQQLVGMLMDLVSPLFPSAFIFVVCLGSISRSFTGVASGATRAALTQHFALQNNAADISAKEGSQETMATMVGMALGMLVARVTTGYPFAIWLCFLSLTVFHMYANYRAVCCLALNSLNMERSSILLQHFMKTGHVLSPEQVSRMEHILPLWITPRISEEFKLLHSRVLLGVRISSLHQNEVIHQLHASGSHYRKAKYLLLERKGIISTIVHKDANAFDILKSFVHALVLADRIGGISSIHLESQSWMDKHYETFIQKLSSSGWKTGRLLCPSIIWTANWKSVSSNDKTD